MKYNFLKNLSCVRFAGLQDLMVKQNENAKQLLSILKIHSKET